MSSIDHNSGASASSDQEGGVLEFYSHLDIDYLPPDFSTMPQVATPQYRSVGASLIARQQQQEGSTGGSVGRELHDSYTPVHYPYPPPFYEPQTAPLAPDFSH
ncbi:uncharacterized protein AB675_8154 [Cyphellophora attinorum]|uniref:Uncharacterized protein n=1 Tax=Cyphellophora attinorum TaxID=1664694 RepID=A0A0N0NNC4_9EURO|nr:uncharacterized protein AB675_8154 [Phialophora attinorum]KPI41209.1 hypothetical protein AB675_8154 [Phialophora attinorum]